MADQENLIKDVSCNMMVLLGMVRLLWKAYISNSIRMLQIPMNNEKVLRSNDDEFQLQHVGNHPLLV